MKVNEPERTDMASEREHPQSPHCRGGPGNFHESQETRIRRTRSADAPSTGFAVWSHVYACPACRAEQAVPFGWTPLAQPAAAPARGKAVRRA
jgi:hypothetical protein